MSAEKTPAERQLVEGQQSETNVQEGNETVAIVAPDTETNNQEAAIEVGARLSGGTITIEPDYFAFLGRELIFLHAPSAELHLDAHEGRDLAAALLQLAERIDGAQPRELHRPAGLTEPATEGIGGGL